MVSFETSWVARLRRFRWTARERKGSKARTCYTQDGGVPVCCMHFRKSTECPNLHDVYDSSTPAQWTRSRVEEAALATNCDVRQWEKGRNEKCAWCVGIRIERHCEPWPKTETPSCTTAPVRRVKTTSWRSRQIVWDWTWRSPQRFHRFGQLALRPNRSILTARTWPFNPVDGRARIHPSYWALCCRGNQDEARQSQSWTLTEEAAERCKTKTTPAR